MRCSTVLSGRSSIDISFIQQTHFNTSKLDILDWFTGRPRRNRDGATAQNQDAPAPPPSADGSSSSIERTDRSPSLTSTHRTHSTPNSSTLLYLQPEYAVCTRSLTECNIHDLIRQPNGVDKNEWVANNIVAFYNHVNALYNAMHGFCTAQNCPVMTGPQNSSYLWIDEKNKKLKCSAPQYVDNTLMYIQRTLSDETIFPTRLDQQFPLCFDSLVRKMVRLLFHTIAHLYEKHFHQLIDVQLHPHLNSLFLHFILFLITSNIISSPDSSIVNNCSTTNNSSSSSLTIPGQTDARELRADLDSLDDLYQILGKQWQLAYGQICAQKRRAAHIQHE